MYYELWDTESGNLLYDFGTEAEALTAVRELIAINAPDAVNSITLLQVDERGAVATLAMGPELVRRARGADSTSLSA